MLKFVTKIRQKILLNKIQKLNSEQYNLVEFNNSASKYDILWHDFMAHKEKLINFIMLSIKSNNMYVKSTLSNLINLYYSSINILIKKSSLNGNYLKLNVDYVKSLSEKEWHNNTNFIIYLYYHISKYSLPKAVQKKIIDVLTKDFKYLY